MKKERVLFFDILRILGIFLIIFFHAINTLGLFPAFNYNTYVGYIYQTSIGGIGVTIMLIVSGAVLEFAHRDLSNVKNYMSFIFHRLKRLYPAYWISLILGLIISISLIHTSIIDLILQFSGLMVYSNLITTHSAHMGGPINSSGWFIGLIIVLYALYPLISRLIKWNPHLSIIFLLVLELAARAFFAVQNIGYMTN